MNVEVLACRNCNGYSEVRIAVPPQDTYVVLVLPNGQEVEIQFTVEEPAIDVCLPDVARVTCWKDDDLNPAEVTTWTTGKGRRLANQLLVKRLCLDLDPAVLGTVAPVEG